MEGLLREPYSEGIVIGLDGRVYFSSDPARRDTHLSEIDGHALPGPEASLLSGDTPDRISSVQDSTGTYLTCLSPLRPDGKLTGFLYLKVGTEISEAEKRQISLLFALGSLGTIVLTAAILSLLLHWLVSRRLNRLVEVFQRFARGEYATRAQPMGGADEISTLMHGFNGLAQRLEETLAHLRESETLLNTTQRLTKVGGWEFDVRSGKSFWTEELYRIHEIPEDPDIDHVKESLACYSPKDRQTVNDAFQRACEQGEAYDLELQFTTHTGKPLWVRTTAQPVYEDGKVVRLVGNLLDITAQKKAEAEIRKLNQELELRVTERTAQLQASNQELEAFCYSVSHDLRAPLRHVDGYVELLVSRCRDDLDEQGRHYVETIAASARQMGVLIDDLLQFSRTGRVELLHEKIDMNQVLRQALAPVREASAGRSIEWVIGDLPQVRGDSALLRQVWTNLLANAAKYTRSREAARIEVGCRKMDDEIVFFIADNGVGFDMRYAGKLFGVFQRLHSQEEFEGTGIGLATVQRIVSRHGGRVWAEAELDRGARFYFALPVHRELFG
jgi:signal transduction histidine kinase